MTKLYETDALRKKLLVQTTLFNRYKQEADAHISSLLPAIDVAAASHSALQSESDNMVESKLLDATGTMSLPLFRCVTLTANPLFAQSECGAQDISIIELDMKDSDGDGNGDGDGNRAEVDAADAVDSINVDELIDEMDKISVAQQSVGAAAPKYDATPTPASAYTEETLNALSVRELRDICALRNLNKKGIKHELIANILAADKTVSASLEDDDVLMTDVVDML
jgi:hypothetical protein